MPQGSNYQRKVEVPPPTGNPAFDQWALTISQWINSHPHMSWFSGTTPNSTLTGTPGQIAVNLASGSTVSRLWVMGGDPTSIATNLGWRFLSTGGS